MKMPGQCAETKFLTKNLGKWRSHHLLGEHDPVRQRGRSLAMVRKVFGIREAKNCCRPEQMGTKECGKVLKIILENGRIPAVEAKKWRIEGQKEKNHEKGVSEACEQV